MYRLTTVLITLCAIFFTVLAAPIQLKGTETLERRVTHTGEVREMIVSRRGPLADFFTRVLGLKSARAPAGMKTQIAIL